MMVINSVYYLAVKLYRDWFHQILALAYNRKLKQYLRKLLENEDWITYKFMPIACLNLLPWNSKLLKGLYNLK